jgi:hypothetical protein
VPVAEQQETGPRSYLGRETVPDVPFVEVKGPRSRLFQKRCALRRESERLCQGESRRQISGFPIQEETGSISARLLKWEYRDSSDDERVLHQVNGRLVTFEHVESEQQVYVFSLGLASLYDILYLNDLE